MIELIGPDIEFKKSRFSDEEVYQVNIIEKDGNTYTSYFNIKNKADESFTLKSIGVSCGCTTPNYERLTELKKDETTKVEFTFKVDKNKVESGGNIYTKYMYIQSMNENEKPISLHINCTVSG